MWADGDEVVLKIEIGPKNGPYRKNGKMDKIRLIKPPPIFERENGRVHAGYLCFWRLQRYSSIPPISSDPPR